jgi:uncharacterized protein YerC
MKKFLSLLFAAMLLMACGTPTVSHLELYGTVEEIISVKDYYQVKAWCKSKQTYYKVKTKRTYQIGEVIRIK